MNNMKIKTLMPIPDGYNVVFYNQYINTYGVAGSEDSLGCPLIAITTDGYAKLVFFCSDNEEFQENTDENIVHEFVSAEWLKTHSIKDVF